ncbi:MAG TPA: hypothetical protein DIW47_03080 [Bacteroidetes bacterium]|nr:hypothetical protein [Bacteroidota bacterium]
MRRLIFIVCTAAIGTGIFWMIKETEKTGSETSILEPPSIIKKGKGSSIKKEKTSPQIQAEDHPSAQKFIRSIAPQSLFTWPIESAPAPEMAEVKETMEEWAAKPHFREVKNIVPPIEGVLPPSSATLVTKEVIDEGGIVNLGFQALLHLPADGLVDEWGNPINEPVKISYCPLSDPVDVYLSGVPMSYDSAGTTETFRTAGMVRLEAETYSGKKVILKRGQSMRLDMPTTKESDDFNFYTFNEEQGRWEFNRPAPPSRPAIDLAIDTSRIQYAFDITPFAEKFEKLNYHYLMDKPKKRRKEALRHTILTSYTERSMRSAMYNFRYSNTNMIKLNPHYAIIGYKEDKTPIRELRFKLATIGVGVSHFRELKHFSGFSFVAEDVKDLHDFYAKYRRGRRIHDIRIEYTPGDDHCTFILKDEKEFVRLEARIASKQGVLNEFAKIRFNLAYARYGKDLERKEKIHDMVLQKEKRNFFTSFWQGRTGGRGIAIFNGTNYRQLNLPGFATYNCDQIARMVNPQRISRKFVDEDGSDILPYQVTVCDTRVEATFNFTYYYNIAPACSKGGLGFVLVVAEGKTFYLSGKEAEGQLGSVQIELKELPDIENAGELRALLFGG